MSPTWQCLSFISMILKYKCSVSWCNSVRWVYRILYSGGSQYRMPSRHITCLWPTNRFRFRQVILPWFLYDNVKINIATYNPIRIHKWLRWWNWISLIQQSHRTNVITDHVLFILISHHYIDGLVQERRNSIANALELRLSCTNPSI